MAVVAVVDPNRAGEAAGVSLAVLVGLSGVGVVVASTVIKVLDGRGMDEGDAIRWVRLVIGGVALLTAVLTIVVVPRRMRDRPPAPDAG